MAATREQIDLVLNTIGASGVQDLKAKYAELVTQLGEVTAAMGRDDKAAKDLEADYRSLGASAKNLGGTIAQLEAAQARDAAAAQRAADAKVKAFDQAIAALNREQAAEDRKAAAAEKKADREAAAANREAAKVTDALDRKAAAQRKAADATTRAAAAQDRASTGSAKYQQNIIGLGNAFNDFFGVTGSLSQRLNAIANNLPMVFAGFGNLGLALSGITPIIAMIIQNWDHLVEALTGSATEWGKSIDGMKKKLSDLEGKKVKVGVDLMEIGSLKAQIKEVEDAINAVNRLKTGQTEEERGSGQAVGKAMEETVGPGGKALGGAEIVAQLKAVFVPEFERFFDPLVQLRKQEAEVGQKVESTTKGIAAATAKGDKATADMLSRFLDPLKAQQKQLQEDVRSMVTKVRAPAAEGGLAETALGMTVEGAEKGKGAKQAAAQARIADLARKANLQALADQVEGETVAAQRDANLQQQRGRNQEKMRKLTVDLLNKQGKENELIADADTIAIEKQQKVALAEIGRQDKVKVEAERLASSAKARGLDDVDAYEETWRGLYAFLKRELAKQGAAPTGRLVNEAARQFAGQAPQLVEAQRNAQREAGKAAVGRQTALENASIEKSGLDKQAALMLADMQRQMNVRGSVATPRGERRLSSEQQFEVVRQAMIKRLTAMNRGMRQGEGKERAGDIATAIAAMGRKMLEDFQREAVNQNFGFQRQQMAVDGQAMGPVGVGMVNQMQQMARDQALPRPGAGPAAPFMAPNEGFRSVPPAAPTAVGPQALLGPMQGLQQGQAGLQAVESGLIRRVAALERQIAATNRGTGANLAQLNVRNQPMQPSALPFGIA